jgi:hypothetical protein
METLLFFFFSFGRLKIGSYEGQSIYGSNKRRQSSSMLFFLAELAKTVFQKLVIIRPVLDIVIATDCSRNKRFIQQVYFCL